MFLFYFFKTLNPVCSRGEKRETAVNYNSNNLFNNSGDPFKLCEFEASKVLHGHI